MSRFQGTPARSWQWFVLAGAFAVGTPVQAQQSAQPAPAGDVVGVGNLAHIVADLD